MFEQTDYKLDLTIDIGFDLPNLHSKSIWKENCSRSLTTRPSKSSTLRRRRKSGSWSMCRKTMARKMHQKSRKEKNHHLQWRNLDHTKARNCWILLNRCCINQNGIEIRYILFIVLCIDVYILFYEWWFGKRSPVGVAREQKRMSWMSWFPQALSRSLHSARMESTLLREVRLIICSWHSLNTKRIWTGWRSQAVGYGHWRRAHDEGNNADHQGLCFCYEKDLLSNESALLKVEQRPLQSSNSHGF